MAPETGGNGHVSGGEFTRVLALINDRLGSIDARMETGFQSVTKRENGFETSLWELNTRTTKLEEQVETAENDVKTVSAEVQQIDRSGCRLQAMHQAEFDALLKARGLTKGQKTAMVAGGGLLIGPSAYGLIELVGKIVEVIKKWVE